WRTPFNVYWIGLFIFILVLFYLPDNKPITIEKGKEKENIPLSVYGYALAACGVMLAYIAIATNMALFLEQSKLGGSQIAGFVIAFSTVGGLMTSVSITNLQYLFNTYLMLAGFLVMGFGFGIITISHSIILIMIGVCF